MIRSKKVKSSYCPRCGLVKPRSEFWEDPRYKSGLKSYCKPCTQRCKVAAHPKRVTTGGEPTTKRCSRCRGVISFGTDLNGVLVQFCHCGTTIVPVKTPGTFHRYEATAARLVWLEEKVAMQCRPIAEAIPENSKHEGRIHPWRQRETVRGSKGKCA